MKGTLEPGEGEERPQEGDLVRRAAQSCRRAAGQLVDSSKVGLTSHPRAICLRHAACRSSCTTP